MRPQSTFFIFHFNFFTDIRMDKASFLLLPRCSSLLIAPSASSLLPPRRSFLLFAPFSSSLLPPPRSFFLLAPSSSSLLDPPRSLLHFDSTKHYSFHSESVNIVNSSNSTKALRTNQPTDQQTDKHRDAKKVQKCIKIDF